MKNQVIDAFRKEFKQLADKFEIMDLLEDNSPMDYETIRTIFLPSNDNNIVWHPGVYVFIGDGKVFKVGVSLRNSRARVLQHLKVSTKKNEYCIWDINEFDDKSILLFNVKEFKDRHWLLALEAYLEQFFSPKIPSGRIG